MTEPRFTDDELAQLLKRAIALQASRADRAHSLADVQRIAAQVGIDPSDVARAAATLHETPISERPGVAGESPCVRLVEWLGAPAEIPDQGSLVSAIRSQHPALGTVQPLEHGFEWHAYEIQDGGSVLVGADLTPGRVAIRVEGRYNALRLRLAIGGVLLGLCFAYAGATVSPLAGVVAGVLGMAASLAGLRLAWNVMLRRRRDRLQRLLGAVVARFTMPASGS